jgi:hypothetical protein
MELVPQVGNRACGADIPVCPANAADRNVCTGKPYRFRLSVLVGVLGGGLLLTSGCAAVSDSILPGGDGPPTGKVAQVSAIWHNEVIRSPDQANKGQMIPGLAGKIYLFGPNSGQPLASNGILVVDLYDPSRKGPNGGPMPVSHWELTKEMQAKCLQHDMIGWGYVLMLPWLEYRPEMKEVVLKVHYEEPKALPIYSEPSRIAFNFVQDYQSARSTQPIVPRQDGGIVPASHQTPANPR